MTTAQIKTLQKVTSAIESEYPGMVVFEIRITRRGEAMLWPTPVFPLNTTFRCCVVGVKGGLFRRAL